MSALDILLSQPVPQAIAWALLHSLWQGVLVAAALALVLQVGRRWSPDVRYLIGCVALASLLLVPALTAASIAQRLAVPPGEVSLLDVRVAELAAGTPVVEGAPATPSRAGPRLAAGEAITQAVRPALPWILLVWLLGVAAFLARGIRDQVVLGRLRRLGRLADQAVQQVLERLVRRAGITRRVEVRVTERVRGPGVMGWLRPLILLPPALLLHLTPQQLELILAHELAHVRRNDYLVNLLQSVVEMLLFFNPAMWWISSRVRIEREHACDRFAVTLGGDAIAYARALTDLAAIGLHPSPSPGLAFAGSKGMTLMDRIARILDLPAAPLRARRSAAGLFATAAALTVATFLGQSAVAQVNPGDAAAAAARMSQQLEVVERANTLRDRNLSAVRRALADASPLTRAAAVKVLGEAGRAPDASRLVRFLDDSSAFVRKEAVVALGIMSHESAVPRLLQALQDRDPGVREQSAYAIAIIGSDHRGHTGPIAALVRDSVASVRKGVARALGLLGDSLALSPLNRLANDSVESVRNAARQALALLGAGSGANQNFNFDYDPDRDRNPNYNIPPASPRR